MRTLKFLLFINLFFFSPVIFGQTNSLKDIFGKIVVQNSNLNFAETVTITNQTSKAKAISDDKGQFSIVAKTGDILSFSAANLDPMQKIITPEDLKSDIVIIKLSPKNIELQEIVINNYPNITAEKLGIIPYGQKKYTAAERKLYTATSSPTEALLNMFSGRTDMLKKEIIVQEKERLYLKIENLCEETYYTDRLNIPIEYLKDFKKYCIESSEFADSLDYKNKATTMFIMTGLAHKYLEIIEVEKKQKIEH